MRGTNNQVLKKLLFCECPPCLGNLLHGKKNILTAAKEPHDNHHSHEQPSDHTNTLSACYHKFQIHKILAGLGNSNNKNGKIEDWLHGIYSYSKRGKILQYLINLTFTYLKAHSPMLSQNPRVNVVCEDAITAVGTFKIGGPLTLLCF